MDAARADTFVRPVRILALVTEAFGGRGGIAQYNRDLILALAAGPRAASAQILPRLAPDPPGSLPPGVVQHRPLFARAAYALKALWLVARTRPDVVFCGHLYMAPLAGVLAALARARLAVQLHGVETWTSPTPAQRRAVESADLVLCVSRDTRRHVLAWSNQPPERVVVLPNTVGEGYAPGDAAAARARLGLGQETVLLSVGRLDARERYKGHERVIRLLPELLREHGPMAYLIAGDGDDRPRLEALARDAGVAAHVRFLGQVEHADLPLLYRAADAFVLPSTGEGFGIVYLEAMACGTPAIGLAAGGAADALGDGDLGAAVADEDLAAAILRALVLSRGRAPADAARRDLAQRTRDRFGVAQFRGFAQALLACVT
ncbi:MAG: glycosyltransferase [Phenylobacterium sp.]|uniref:glycosyltransferase n=1 Tax=Phenylobacterium sp. TaxID=1871053 RepID=UPI00391D5362